MKMELDTTVDNDLMHFNNVYFSTHGLRQAQVKESHKLQGGPKKPDHF